MACQSCYSSNVREYTAEINIHFPGMKGLSTPSVLVFPKLLVCMDCGAAKFEISDAERKELADRDHRVFIDEAAG